MLLDPTPFDEQFSDSYSEPNFSSWDTATHGPEPRPDWVVTELSAIDTEFGILKTGKEADVHLVRRALEGGPESLLAAKRYRGLEHRQFHRDSTYTEGRRMRNSRDQRAAAKGTRYGRVVQAGQWARAEFGYLCALWSAGIPVPYPVQLDEVEVLMELITGTDGVPAPRLVQTRPARPLLGLYWEQLVAALRVMAGLGLAHGDLSPFNLLVHRGRLVLIDLPQVVDIVGNPQGPAFLARDVRIVTDWFLAHGLPPQLADAGTARVLIETPGRCTP